LKVAKKELKGKLYRPKVAYMNDFELMDLYTDYLVSSFGSVTSAGLSKLLDEEISHDRISRMLSRKELTQHTTGEQSSVSCASLNSLGA
jgi:hypothetical protein